MSRAAEQNQWSAQHTLNYINGLIAVDVEQDETTIYTALSIAYEYLVNATKKKITWSLSLQKLAYQFIDLAFETNLHASVKDIFKSYRAITQGQYSESLQCVLEYYRDNKLETILDEEFKEGDLEIIKALPNIESEDPSPEIIFQSIDPEKVRREMDIKNKLKIVWEGYKSIVETVRVNQKLEGVYMETLQKIFKFVEEYNRVQQFKSFCKSQKSGLQSTFNKRDRTYIEKTIYIDIEKTDVNTRNIEIRMKQFKITVNLGLWSEAFSVLDDINTLIKIRKAPLKNSLRCQYFENLSLIFRKNNFWHYHAYAYYNYYLAKITKPRITPEEKQSNADTLLLSILVIPAVTVESHQSKEIQDKLAAMMISSTKVPDRNELEELMVSKGVLENASDSIREIWNFMFLEFGVGSLKKGLELVSTLKAEHSNFKELIQACLINKQLISIAEIYQRIRIQSLERLILLPLDQIKKMLILAHRQRIINFTFDECQGIIVFQDQSQEINPSEEFHNLFMSVALNCERKRKYEEKHIMNKAQDWMENAEHYIWNNRVSQIEQFKKQKIKVQIPELQKKMHEKKKQWILFKQNEEAKRIQAEQDALKQKQEYQKALMAKRIIIDDIKMIKENRVVRILDKKIENLTDEEIQNIDIEVLKQHLELTKRRINNNKEARLKKAFTHVDYLQRQRRDLISKNIKQSVLNEQDEQKVHQEIIDTAKKNYHDHNEQKAKLQNLAKFYKNRVESELKKVYNQFDKDTDDYHSRLEQNFKEKIIAKARALHEENQNKKLQQLKLQEQQRKNAVDSYEGGMWSFAKKRVETKPTAPVLSTAPKKPEVSAPISKGSKNIFEKLEGLETKEEPPKKTEGKWGIGTKKTTTPVEQKQEPKKVETPVEAPKDQKWSIGTKKIEQVKPIVTEVKPIVTEVKPVFVPPPPAVEKKGKWGAAPEKKVEEKKKIEEKKPEVKKGKAW